MTIASATSDPAERTRLFGQQHLVLDGISWDYYEQTLEELGNRPVRVTYDHGRMEIMPPLSEHELPKGAIGRLLEAMAEELNLPMTGAGSTTFKSKRARGGLEPDECYYLQNESRVRGMKRFDPGVYPPPDLAIEIDITARSISRQPIYAALGVPELWRFDGERFSILILQSGDYQPAERSAAFPFLPMEEFTRFVHRMFNEEQTSVAREFRRWVRTLASA